MERVSKNFCKGEVIASVEELMEVAENRGSVYHHYWKLKPAAFLISMQCRIIYRLIANKTLFKIIKYGKL